jgi:hypothetical protein
MNNKLRDWIMGILSTILLTIGGIGYDNIQKDLHSILENQKIAYSQVNVNTEQINTLRKDLSELEVTVQRNKEYTDAKLDLYDSNLRDFYKNMKFRPVTELIHDEPDAMYVDRKYYDSLYSMFDVALN